MIDEENKLKRIINIGIELAGVKDIDVLLERVLSEAREFANADAGSIYIKDEDRLKFSYTQNDTLQSKLAKGKKLIYSTFTIPINNNSISGHVAHTGELLNLPDVYTLGDVYPFSFNRSFDELTGYRTKSMLTIPLKTNRGEIAGVLQLINCKDASGNVIHFRKDEEPMMVHFANLAAMAIERARMTRSMILRMAKMAELRDPKETGAHVNRVASYSLEIYEKWAIDKGTRQEEIAQGKDILRMAAMLHDVGKVGIPDAILKKPARLDPDEYEIMKNHTILGARMFSDIYSEFDESSSIVALNHHERWDGKGYPGHINPFTGSTVPGYETESGKPRGKKEEEIPVFGRIVAVADVYDALSSKRVYKEKWDESEVLETLTKERGKQFDAEMIDAFLSVLDIIKNISERYPDH
ncbi:MAG: GAF domain-containing protein [Nitrospirae bacterium]|nr:MAG: GAF domain-containing protein [Nitrospirota bacterium]